MMRSRTPATTPSRTALSADPRFVGIEKYPNKHGQDGGNRNISTADVLFVTPSVTRRHTTTQRPPKGGLCSVCHFRHSVATSVKVKRVVRGGGGA